MKMEIVEFVSTMTKMKRSFSIQIVNVSNRWFELRKCQLENSLFTHLTPTRITPNNKSVNSWKTKCLRIKTKIEQIIQVSFPFSFVSKPTWANRNTKRFSHRNILEFLLKTFVFCFQNFQKPNFYRSVELWKSFLAKPKRLLNDWVSLCYATAELVRSILSRGHVELQRKIFFLKKFDEFSSNYPTIDRFWI